jgi:hypothetical protein
MQHKQAACVFEFVPDLETLKILEAVGHGTRDQYINDAIKAFSRAAPPARTPVAGNSAADQVNAELQRLFGDTFVAIIASKADHDDYVVLKEVRTPAPVQCGIKDVLDILKSLRQPITAAEVWEIISVLS